VQWKDENFATCVTRNAETATKEAAKKNDEVYPALCWVNSRQKIFKFVKHDITTLAGDHAYELNIVLWLNK
jgi:hypothetical protein